MTGMFMRNRRKAEEKVHIKKNPEIGVVGATSQRLPRPSQELTERGNFPFQKLKR